MMSYCWVSIILIKQQASKQKARLKMMRGEKSMATTSMSITYSKRTVSLDIMSDVLGTGAPDSIEDTQRVKCN